MLLIVKIKILKKANANLDYLLRPVVW